METPQTLQRDTLPISKYNQLKQKAWMRPRTALPKKLYRISDMPVQEDRWDSDALIPKAALFWKRSDTTE